MDESILHPIDSSEGLDEIFAHSLGARVWLFKHSSECPLSSQALREFQRFAEAGSPRDLFAVLTIQQQRQLSNEVTRRTGLAHASPQVILLLEERPRWHASHWDITVGALGDAARAAAGVATPADSAPR